MKKKRLIFPIILTVLSFIYTLMVKNIDVKSIGPNNSSVWFSTLNKEFKNFIGHNMTIYKITEILGYLVLLLVLMYGIIGLRQLIKRKSLMKVDKELLILGVFYIVMLITYIFFEKCIINYRPILIDGELEASYPSSHTLLALCVGFSSIIVNKKYINKEYISNFNKIIIGLVLLVFFGRTISGVHWISDILGGVIISSALLSWFYTIYNYEKID